MAKDRFFIGPMTSGLQKNVKPFMIADNAFEKLENAYLFRGRVRKRFGEKLMKPAGVTPADGYEQFYSRLGFKLAVQTNAGGNWGPAAITPTVPAWPNPLIGWPIGGTFVVKNLAGAINIFTVYQDGVMLSSNTPAATGNFVLLTGTLTLNNTLANADVWYYPGLPVMGFVSNEVFAINLEPVYAFDTMFSYKYTAAGWDRLDATVWHGNDSNFFWGEPHRANTGSETALFVTNYNFPNATLDPIRYWLGAAWANLLPATLTAPGNNVIKTARIIISFKNRLVLLNTVEGPVAGAAVLHQNRCRFSQNGNPLLPDAWLEDVPGKGGWIDLPTQEAIITAQHLRDRVIVYCERSTWELCYTGNQILPFVWQQLNTELGAESTFSQIPFDEMVLGVGNVGIHMCNGMQVQRIDQLIPNTVFQIHNENNGIERVCGVRDYPTEMVYWSYPAKDRTSTAPYPNRILAYNYAAQSWAFFDDSITAFGYTQEANTQLTWSSVTGTWAQWIDTWAGPTSVAANRSIVMGNQEGFTLIVKPDETTNDESLQISNLTYLVDIVTLTVVNHNLTTADYVQIYSAQGMTTLNGKILKVLSVTSKDVLTLAYTESGTTPLVGIYTGGGTLTRVSRIDILTKQYNFYAEQGKNAYIEKIEFHVDKTVNGQIAYDYWLNSAEVSTASNALTSQAAWGLPILSTSPYTSIGFESHQARLWHAIYLQAEGECIQLRLYLSPAQMVVPAIIQADFQLNGMLIYSSPTSRLQ